MILGTCFTLVWVLRVLIWLVVVAAVVAILRVVIPWALGVMGIPTPAIQVMNIIMVAVVVIALLLFVIEILVCLRIA